MTVIGQATHIFKLEVDRSLLRSFPVWLHYLGEIEDVLLVDEGPFAGPVVDVDAVLPQW